MIIRKVFIICSISILAMLLLARGAEAVEPLSTEELTAHCVHYTEDHEGVDATFCVRYIQGFIDGAVATDERVALNVAAEYDRKETFSERAVRTRGVSRTSQYGPTVYAEFCLGEPVPLKAVVETVVHDLESLAVVDERLHARTAVYQSLRRAYPCTTEDEE
jgi:hypothetical protein